MNPWIGWSLAALALIVGWRTQGWPGVALAVSVIVFWLLLQLTASLRVMRRAGQAPIGHVASAVMLHSKLCERMLLLDVVRASGSLGYKLRDEPETYAWTDPGGASVQIEVEGGRLRHWSLLRPAGTEAAP